MAKLIGRYLFEIYDDGSIKISRMDLEETNTKDENIVRLSDMSGKNAQILCTLKRLIEEYDTWDQERDGFFEIKPRLKDAMDYTSKKFEVQIQSIMDKMTRQQGGIDMNEFRKEVSDFIYIYGQNLDTYTSEEVQNGIELKSRLLTHISNKSGKRDRAMINRFFLDPHINMI